MKTRSMKNPALIALMSCSLCGAVTLAAHQAWADDGQFSLTGGFNAKPGKYGAENSADILVNQTIGKYETGPWEFKLTVPDASISGTRGVASGNDPIRAGSTTGSTLTGKSDSIAAATYNIYSGGASSFGIGLTGKVKLGIADKITGLGNGQNDYAAEADAYQSFNKFTALGSLGYKVLGSPAGFSTDSMLYGSVGGIYQLNDQISGGVDINLVQGPSATAADQRNLTAYLSHNINKSMKARGYVLKGFSNGSPDTGLGAQVYYGF
jgi:hypothetical protein